ncbi:succinylglutamate desuccinylase/aspartoacylase family protein [Rickettsiales bacterium]|nr:succinylglutamate desuccinylase/aspartoacylase family protein [Rickettsiales bacterium]
MQKELIIGGTSIFSGQRKQIEVFVAKLFDYTEMTMPVEVIRGKEDGPKLFISAAIHGDEINGVESIKRLLAKKKALSKIKGTLIAVPIVNVFGFNRNIRYLPDRRDLNRCFPGSESSSLGGQIANIFMTEIGNKCTHGIDLHTAAINRTNIAQIRACLGDAETKRLAMNFGVPVVLNSELRDGSLRQAALDKGIPMLLFEGGQALRYEEKIIKTTVNGILSVMQSIGMIEGKSITMKQRKKEVFIARSSHWIRAPHSGSLRVKKDIGSRVKKDELLGVLSDPFGGDKIEVRAKRTGIVIGMTLLPLVNNGDALFHIATFEDSQEVLDRVGVFDEDLES